ncbi:MAG TPA: TIGR03862 family flavoprotein [Bdellovibrionota bacterium]|jgi:hypothetical protein
MSLSCAIIGTGPAALAAATALVRKGIKPTLFERRPAPGWKLLVAGSSGLNITYDCPEDEMPSFYSARQAEMGELLRRFPRSTWLELLRELGEEPYVGSSRRYFIKSKTAANLLKAWTESLEQKGARFEYNEVLTKVIPGSPLTLEFASGRKEKAQTALLALGGGSWESEEQQWPEMLRELGLDVRPLEPANAGFSFAADPAFFPKAEGKPVKGVILKTAKGERQGELMITKYGLEGTPVYTVGTPGPATLDLKPDLDETKLAARIAQGRGSVWQKVENSAKLSQGALFLLKEFSPEKSWLSPNTAAAAIKGLKIELLAPRPLSESISARGGLSWDELDENLQCKKIPGLFCAGEMLDWDAPTGGFLIQACVSQGFAAASKIQALAAQ